MKTNPLSLIAEARLPDFVIGKRYDSPSSLQWHPDGKSVACFGNDNLWTVRVTSCGLTVKCIGAEDRFYFEAVSPELDRAYARRYESPIVSTIDISSGKTIAEFSVPFGYVDEILYDHNDAAIISIEEHECEDESGPGRPLIVWKNGSVVLQRIISYGDRPLQRYDSRHLLLKSSLIAPASFSLLDLDEGSPQRKARTVDLSTSEISASAWCINQKRDRLAAFAGSYYYLLTLPELMIIEKKSLYKRLLVVSAAFSSDGNLLFAGDEWGGLAIYDIAQGRRLLHLQIQDRFLGGGNYGRDYELTAIALSPDGLHLATIGTDGIFRYWDISKLPGAPEPT